MDYKIYYKEIEKRLEEFSDVVYYKPMSNEDIIEIEKQIGQTIKPLYREFLLTFGIVQDVFLRLETNLDSLVKDYHFIKKSLKEYIPIFSELDVEDTIFIIKNDDLLDDFVYSIKVNINDKITKFKKQMSFQQIIEESISDLKKNHKERSLNKDKVNNTEFEMSAHFFNIFIEAFTTEGLKRKTEWKPKYYPKNYFGDEISTFELYNHDIVIQRNADHTQFSFEIEEPILTSEENSLIKKTEDLFKIYGIECEKTECFLI